MLGCLGEVYGRKTVFFPSVGKIMFSYFQLSGSILSQSNHFRDAKQSFSRKTINRIGTMNYFSYDNK